MTNDLNTLSGALLEMKDQLIYELGQKGVTASYSSSDGLLGLIGKISEIQTGGGSCYNVTFGNTSYTTTGSVTVSVSVLKNYSACVGETVTFTSSTSTTTTATTDSNGVATATISFSGSTTLTASIGGATDTATVTVQTVTYLFQDVGVIGNYNTNYVNTNNGVQAVVGNTGTTISCSTYADSFRYADVLISGDFRVTITFVDTTDWGCDIALLNSSKSMQYYIQKADAPNKWQGGVGISTFTKTNSYDPVQYSPVTYERVGSTMTVKADGNLVDSRTITSADVYFALKTHSAGNRNFTFKDLTIEQL